jgi:hypothetical protein
MRILYQLCTALLYNIYNKIMIITINSMEKYCITKTLHIIICISYIQALLYYIFNRLLVQINYSNNDVLH